jgi:hypothetical protein
MKLHLFDGFSYCLHPFSDKDPDPDPSSYGSTTLKFNILSHTAYQLPGIV